VLVPVEQVLLVGLVAGVLGGIRLRVRLRHVRAVQDFLAHPAEGVRASADAAGGAGGFFDVGGAVHACSIPYLQPNASASKEISRNTAGPLGGRQWAAG